MNFWNGMIKKEELSDSDILMIGDPNTPAQPKHTTLSILKAFLGSGLNVKIVEQTLTDAQKLQARTNIDAQKRIETANSSVVAGPGAWPNADIEQEADKGYGNVALGVNAGNDITTGSANALIGNGAGEQITTGANNVAIGGTFALSSNVIGSENTAMGVRALSTILGSGHVGIGAYAGYKAGYNATGYSSVFIGKGATRKNNDTTNNEIVIGAGAFGNGDNSMTLGNTSITDTRIRGEIDNPIFKNGFKLKRNSLITALGTISYNPTNVSLISGTGTNFSSFNVGDTLVFENSQDLYEVEITYINSDTSLTVNTSTALGDGFYGLEYYIVPQEIIDIDMWLYPHRLKDATNAMNFNASVLPKVDDYYSLGSTNKRWSQLYAGTTAISTSDARLKTDIIPFTQDELNAAKQLSREIGTYKFLSAVAEKGESARKHIGMTVQRAIEIMQANNLNPFEYGFICFDSWDDEYKTIPAVEAVEAVEAYDETVEHADGVIEKIFHDAIPAVEAKPERTIKIKSAGEIYSFRYEELLAFICRGFEERLSALENI
jgi:hypothetical protein